MNRSARWFAGGLACLAVGLLHGQTPAPQAPQDPPALAASADAPAPDAACCRLAAGTEIDLEITDPVRSWEHKRGDRFGLRVAEAVVVDGHVVLPTTVVGVGEVVHAAAARGGGAPGELLLAARFLDVAGQPLPLRGMKLGATGEDNSGMALGVSLAAGPFALFIRGREIEIPAGTRAHAKLAQDVQLDLPPTP